MPVVYNRLMLNNKQLFAEIIAQEIRGIQQILIILKFFHKILTHGPGHDRISTVNNYGRNIDPFIGIYYYSIVYY